LWPRSKVCPFGNRKNLISQVQILDIKDGDALTNTLRWVQWSIDPEIPRLWKGLNEERSATLPLQHFNYFPGMLLVFYRIGSDKGYLLISKRTGSPHGAVLWMNKVRASSRMRNLIHINERC